MILSGSKKFSFISSQSILALYSYFTMLPCRFFVLLLVSELLSSAQSWYPKMPFSERRKQWRIAHALTADGSYAAVTTRMPTIRPGKPKKSSSADGVPVPFSVESGQQSIIDHGDTFLTISLDIGSQQIHAIPDSGSFELYIVDGDDCELDLCRAAYKPEDSKRHFEPSNGLSKEIYFGSGACGVELSFDSVHVHNEASSSKTGGSSLIPIWRIVEMDEDLASVWGDGQGFQGIVGLGFKGNLNKESKETLLEEQVVLEARRKTGVDPTRPGMASRALFGDLFAICLPRGEDANPVEVLLEATSSSSQTEGRLWWGDAVPALNYIDVPVVGSRHWTMKIESAFFKYQDDRDVVHHMCEGPCAALVDSGTSLIAMSSKKIDEIIFKTVVGDLKPDCSNVDEMPDLVFSLGKNKQLVLTPDTYVMKLSTSELPMLHQGGRVVLEKGKVLNVRAPPKNLVSLKGKRENAITYCTHAFMETPLETAMVDGSEHELIILGIPVFREYTIRFDRKKETLGFAPHPFGVTCHGDQLIQSAFVEKKTEKRQVKVRTLGDIRSLVFPDEFARV